MARGDIGIGGRTLLSLSVVQRRIVLALPPEHVVRFSDLSTVESLLHLPLLIHRSFSFCGLLAVFIYRYFCKQTKEEEKKKRKGRTIPLLFSAYLTASSPSPSPHVVIFSLCLHATTDAMFSDTVTSRLSSATGAHILLRGKLAFNSLQPLCLALSNPMPPFPILGSNGCTSTCIHIHVLAYNAMPYMYIVQFICKLPTNQYHDPCQLARQRRPTPCFEPLVPRACCSSRVYGSTVLLCVYV